jgi:hypothetical protein
MCQYVYPDAVHKADEVLGWSRALDLQYEERLHRFDFVLFRFQNQIDLADHCPEDRYVPERFCFRKTIGERPDPCWSRALDLSNAVANSSWFDKIDDDLFVHP